MHIIRDQTAQDLIGADTPDLSSFADVEGCVAVLDSAGRIVELNDWSDVALDLDMTPVQEGQVFWSVWPEDTHMPLQRAVSRGLDGAITHYWSRYEHGDGSVTYWDIRVSPLHDPSDRVEKVLAVSFKLEPVA